MRCRFYKMRSYLSLLVGHLPLKICIQPFDLITFSFTSFFYWFQPFFYDNQRLSLVEELQILLKKKNKNKNKNGLLLFRQ